MSFEGVNPSPDMTQAAVDAFSGTSTPGVDAPKIEAPVQNEAEKFFAQKLATLNKREREIRALEHRIKSEKSQGPDPEFQKLMEMKKKAKANPMAWLEAAGLSYDELTEYQLNGGKPQVSEEVLTLQEKIEAMERANAEKEQKAMEEMTAREQQARISDIKSSILENKDGLDLVVGFGDQYELVASVQDEAREQGQELSAKEAAALVEKHLEKQLEPFLKIPKLRKMFGVVDATEVTPDNEARNIYQSQSSDPYAAKTLTNSINQNSASPDREYSEAENRARAIALMRFKD